MSGEPPAKGKVHESPDAPAEPGEPAIQVGCRRWVTFPVRVVKDLSLTPPGERCSPCWKARMLQGPVSKLHRIEGMARDQGSVTYDEVRAVMDGRAA